MSKNGELGKDEQKRGVSKKMSKNGDLRIEMKFQFKNAVDTPFQQSLIGPKRRIKNLRFSIHTKKNSE